MRSDEKYHLRSCLWELTLRCNLRCMHCGSAAGRARSHELAFDECRTVLAELSALGCSELTLIGGEVCLYRGWEQIARDASDRGMLVNVMTNAYRLGEAELAQIRYARLRNVGVSLDGLGEIHNRIRGRVDSFEHVVRAFDLLNAADIPIAVVTSLMEPNADCLHEMYGFLLVHRVQIWQLQIVNPMGNMAGRRDLILNPARIRPLLEFIREKNAERRMIVLAADSLGYYAGETEACIRGRREPICVWEGCQAGITSVFIDSVGNVKGCGALYDDTFVEGNVRDRPLGEIWRNDEAFTYNRAFHAKLLRGRCRHCDVGDVCRGGCRASNYFTSGTLYENAFCPRRAHVPHRGDTPRPAALFLPES